MPTDEKPSITLPASLVWDLERLRTARLALEDDVKVLKTNEDKVKERIRTEMGRFRRAGIEGSERILELVKVDMKERIQPAYSYTLFKIKDPQ